MLAEDLLGLPGYGAIVWSYVMVPLYHTVAGSATFRSTIR
jgi:hypothetical protein